LRPAQIRDFKMFQISNLGKKVTDSISKNRTNWKNRKFASSIVIVILLLIMMIDGFSQELVRARGSYSGYYGYWGYVDKSSGKIIIPCKYVQAKDFCEGLAAVANSYSYWGYIDKTGKVVIPFEYEQAENFLEGIAAVKNNGKWGFIDKNGAEIIPCIYTRRELSIAAEEIERERMAAQELEKLSQKVANIVATNSCDIIFLKDGQEIKAKLIEITLSEIKYKLFEYLDGSTITAAKSDVYVIFYANGTREVFNETNSSFSKKQSFKSCVKNTAFGLDIGIGGGKESKVFSSALGIRVMHHFSPYFGIDFFKINWITDVGIDGVINPWTMKLQLMPGVRGNSPAFYKCMSVYGAFRLGYGMHVATGYSSGLLKGVTDFKGLCLETELGINLTSTIFVGFSYNYHNGFGNYFKSSPWQHTFSTRFGFNFGK